MDTLTPTTLAEVLQEPKKSLLARVLTMLGQERCAAILADTLTIESHGGMLTRAGDRRRSPGGVFLHLVKDRSTGKERHVLFAMQPSTEPQKQTAPSTTPATAAPPVSLTLDLWKGLQPLSVTATLKLVLRDPHKAGKAGGGPGRAGTPQAIEINDPPPQILVVQDIAPSVLPGARRQALRHRHGLIDDLENGPLHRA